MKKQLSLTLLFSLLFSVCTFSQVNKGTIYAVFVGVSEYANPNSNLTFCHKDATSMCEVLKYHTEEENLVLITNQAACRQNIIQKTRDLFAKAKKEDVILFYFSGHGTTGAFCVHDDFLMYSDLRTLFKSTPAKRKLIFADACFSGDMRPATPTQTNANQNNLGTGVLLFLSSRSNQYSIESFSLEGGDFTHYLCTGLKGGADTNGDRLITAKELFNFVHARVKEYTGGDQVPVMWGRFDDNMVILNWKHRKK